MTPRRRGLLLASLLTATLVAAVWVNDRDAEVVKVTAPSKTRKADAAAKSGSGQLALERLQRVPAEEPETVADVFSTKSWYVPPPPPKPVPPPPPAPPPMPYSYMGKLVEDGKVTVFLTKQNRNYAIKQGDTVDGSYRVDTVDTNRVVFTYLPLNMQQTLIIGGTN